MKCIFPEESPRAIESSFIFVIFNIFFWKGICSISSVSKLYINKNLFIPRINKSDIIKKLLVNFFGVKFDFELLLFRRFKF